MIFNCYNHSILSIASSIQLIINLIYKLILTTRIVMGNACTAQQNQIVGFQFDMVDLVQDETLLKNLKNNSSDAPQKDYAQRVSKRPLLNKAVQKSKSGQLSAHPLQMPQKRGIALPAYFIKILNAYYQGQWKRGIPQGLGKMYFQNGSYYQGPFDMGIPSGKDGFFLYPDGSFKRGNVKQGCMQGKGVFVSKQRNFRYEGDWTQDKPNGKGIQYYADGSKYEGNFVNGLKEDKYAVYTWPNGKTYTGAFKQGFMQGYGKIKMQGGKGEYQGQFSRNLIVGQGKMKTQTGQYEGPFVNGEMDGKGRFRWYDGKVYDGHFEKGQLHGEGMITYPNGQIAKGTWSRGQNIDLDGVVSGKAIV